MEHNSQIRVLAVDDHATFRKGIVLFVETESDMQVVAEATNGREAVEQFLVQLGQTLSAWSEEIVGMWRFTRNNAITEGFHNKICLI